MKGQLKLHLHSTVPESLWVVFNHILITNATDRSNLELNSRLAYIPFIFSRTLPFSQKFNLIWSAACAPGQSSSAQVNCSSPWAAEKWRRVGYSQSSFLNFKNCKKKFYGINKNALAKRQLSTSLRKIHHQLRKNWLLALNSNTLTPKSFHPDGATL